ncbi:hypothetical protein FHW79_006535 [Azospirillum sp. OGB3]|uniref:SIR2 family protein n=1 Tax=Azospirillum sp. OGB3 TaxID=2587012 RepID=UPI0016064CBB|nr:SIR2 family protein [Azospirillum sp. OGB3]MBB3268858.1 hypothetical protein [Azospirillum sp. OGB3]
MMDDISSLDPKNAMLFVGAGVSRNLGLPNWSELVAEMGVQLGFDKEVFSLFGDPLTLAEYYLINKKSIGPLRSWMDRNWHRDDIDIATSRVHELIVKIGFPIIYTTNYDRWIEKAFEHHRCPHRKIVNVNDLVALKDGETQVVKYHGDFDDDSTIVLAESTYMDRLQFESPLDIKLRADALSRSVIFIGYSMSDINLRYLFYRLHRTWEKANLGEARPPSFIFMARPNPVQEVVFKKLGIIPIVDETGDPQEGLVQFLQQFARP